MAHKEWKVLLIEDDPMVQEVNKDFITTVKGFTVCATAGNGEEGIKLIKEKQPDLVILDVYMPKKTESKRYRRSESKSLKSMSLSSPPQKTKKRSLYLCKMERLTIS